VPRKVSRISEYAHGYFFRNCYVRNNLKFVALPVPEIIAIEVLGEEEAVCDLWAPKSEVLG